MMTPEEWEAVQRRISNDLLALCTGDDKCRADTHWEGCFSGGHHDVSALLAEVERLREELGKARLDRAEQADEAQRACGHLAGLERFSAAVAKATPCTCSAQRARADALQARLDKVRALHRPVPVYTTEAGDCEHGDDCDAVELSGGSYCPAHTDGLTCNECANLAEYADDLPAYPCPTIQCLEGE